MTTFISRSLLAALASSTALATVAFAQPAPAATDAPSAAEEVVVTGTRVPNRSKLDSVAPVDVITGKALAHYGTGTETAQALAALAPSLDFPRPAISDGSDHIRPATLRGLPPDDTLVLINGLRGHVSALVNINGNIGRGSTAFDLNTIPSVALGTVEVLRDGAAAQYGADAIAGVVNLRLRAADHGGGVVYNIGIYDTSYDTARGSHDSVSDGLQNSIAGWTGVKLGEEGFLTLSGELQSREPTNRSDYLNQAALPLDRADQILGRFGDPDVESGSLWFNAGGPIATNWEAYAFGGIQSKRSVSAATARGYNNAGNVLAVYPDGFLPKIRADISDYNLYGGVRGDVGGFHIDLSAGYGSNTLDYNVLDSINASFGAGSPTTFYAGNLAYDQALVDLNASRPYDIGLSDPLNVAVGLEYRRESFQVSPGVAASYTKAPNSGSIAGNSQGFPGFRPSNAIDVNRDSFSAYVDVEGKAGDLSFGLAGRYEDYSDFGNKVTGKFSVRYDFGEHFALRGSISNGFKAPALQQQYFSYTSTNAITTVVNGQAQTNLIEAGTFRVSDPAAVALGAKPLKPETSTNYSFGGVFRWAGFDLTVDAYQIDVEDRIVYSENLGVSTPTQSAATVAAVQKLLAPFGVSAARFFLNGVDTTTKGIDIVAHYKLLTDTAGDFDFSIAGNFNRTHVTRTPDLPVITAQAQPAFLFDRGNVLSFEKGTPEAKIVSTIDWSMGGFGATIRGTSYDSILVPNNSALLDYQTGSAFLLDLEARYNWENGLGLALGVNNVTDEYPQFTPAAINSPTGSVGFPQYSPYGFNGRFFYGRLSFDW